MRRAKAIGWSVGGQIATTFASLASTVILARLLTPNDYGVFAYALAVFATAQWLLQAGMGQYILREAELTKDKLNGAFAIAMLQGLVGTIIVAIAAPFVGRFAHSAMVGWVTLSVSIVPFLNAAEGISDSYWVRESRFRGVALLQIAKAVLQTVVSVAVELQFGLGPYSLVIGLLASSFLSFCVALWVITIEAGAKPVVSLDQWRILRVFGAKSFLLTLGQAGSAQLPTMIIGRMLGLTRLGHYNRANAALENIAITLVGATARVATPRFFRRVNEGNRLDEAVAEMQELLLFINWPALAGLAVLAGPVVSLLYGGKWDLAAQAVPLLCLAIAIDQARAGGMETLMIRNRLGLNARIELSRCLYIGLFLIVGAHWGLIGALWARVAEAALSFLVYSLMMYRFGGLPLRVWPKLHGSNLLLAFAASAPAAAFMIYWHWPSRLSLEQFVVAIGSSVLAWVLAAASIRHPYYVVGRELAFARLKRVR